MMGIDVARISRLSAIFACIAGAVLTFAPLGAAASPFCIDVTGIPLQCLYVDANECVRRASQLGGICSGNPDELKTPPGFGQFCVVDSSRAMSCGYVDRPTCTQEATRRKGVCIAAIGPSPTAVDPFHVQRPY